MKYILEYILAFQPILKKSRVKSFRTTDEKQWCTIAIASEFPSNAFSLIAAAI
jgi:hypothetical protein